MFYVVGKAPRRLEHAYMRAQLAPFYIFCPSRQGQCTTLLKCFCAGTPLPRLPHDPLLATMTASVGESTFARKSGVDLAVHEVDVLSIDDEGRKGKGLRF
ncbi:hypothetical protein PsYK624_098230 [Phanerochaete sordida]|uniref:Uncharacterized protein n=1 Tax=Phanerochaete sordida TaxID=48140 RepID=A0A9P3GCN3_9APHY|nr:hypothetical protein PsYK624_098230 [Phanerochaete sordida]